MSKGGRCDRRRAPFALWLRAERSTVRNPANRSRRLPGAGRTPLKGWWFNRADATRSDISKRSTSPALVYGGTRKPRLNARLLAFAFDQRLQHGFEGDLSFSRAGVAVLELDPALVEAIQHPNSGCGILHALRSE